MITQAGSPIFATKAFICIEKTFQAAGFQTTKLHNNVISLGEWGWVIGTKKHSTDGLANKINQLDYSDIDTKWITKEANHLMTSFGKPLVDTSNIQVNTNYEPVLYSYYLNGNWNHY